MKPPEVRTWGPSLVIGAFALVLIQAGAMAVGAWGPLDGTFKGPDSYMRLVRVLECVGGLACPDGVVARSNAPYGEAIHWPWLWDWVLILVSAPFRFFMEPRSAVIAAGYLVGPLLGLATILLLTMAAVRVGVTKGLAYVGLLVVCQPYVTFLFAYTRPDHHGIQAAIFAGALLSAIGTLTTGRPIWARLFGVLFGLGVWISTEGLISGLPLLAALGLWWTIKGGAATARLNLEWTTWATGTAILAILVDGPVAGRWSVEFDRISVVHVALFALMAAFWVGSLAWERRGSTKPLLRWVYCGAGAAAAFAAMEMTFPGFHRGPAAEIADPLWTLWLYHTAEYVPLIRRSDATEILIAAVPFLISAPLALWAARSEGDHRWTWGMVVGSLVWFQALGTLQQVRWGTYVHLLSALPLVWLLGRLLASSSRIGPPLLAAGTRVGVVVVTALAPVTIAAMAGLAAGRRDYAVLDACEPGEVISALTDLTGPQGGDATILAPIFWGPEILFRTPHSVIATPYHRNAGIMASHDIMSAPADEALATIRERGVTHLAWCPQLSWLPFVDAVDSPRSLYGQLVAEDYPPWLISLPEPGPGVRIAAVRFGVAAAQREGAGSRQAGRPATNP